MEQEYIISMLSVALFFPVSIGIIILLIYSYNLDKQGGETSIGVGNIDYYKVVRNERLKVSIKKIGLLITIVLLGMSIVFWGLLENNIINYNSFELDVRNWLVVLDIWSKENIINTIDNIKIVDNKEVIKNGLKKINLLESMDIIGREMVDIIPSLSGRISWDLGIDGISITFYLLTTIITPIVILSNWNNIDKKINYYIIIVILVELVLILVFLVKDLLLFYIFFESSLPPLFMLIGLFGSSEKTRAAFYFFIYTLLGSLFMLLAFLIISGEQGSSNIEYIRELNLFYYYQKLIWIGIFISFAVKTPLIPVHLWLPLAHAESPVGGSVFLAGVILKIALYGCLRILLPILPIATLFYSASVYVIAVITIIYASFTTLRQVDLKVMIAYSSIGHMGVILMGAFSNTLQGLLGSIIFSLAHGFVSPALFICCGAILYDRCGTRTINYYRGLIMYLPLFSFFFFIFILANMGTPLTGNFIGEFLSLLGAFQYNIFLTILGATGIFLSASYSIFLYNRISGGFLNPLILDIPDLFRKEFHLLLPLLLLTLLLGIYPNFVISDIEYSLSSLLLLINYQIIDNLNYIM